MPASEETGSGPVIHDHRRIDPVTGQVRGKHAASKPAGTTGAGRPAGAAGSPGSGGTPGPGGPGSSGSAAGAADAKSGQDGAQGGDAAEEVLEGIIEETPAAGQQPSDAEAR